MSERGMILAGDFRIGFYNDAGAFLGYDETKLNTTEFTLTPGEGEQRDRISKMRDTYGQALDSVTTPAPWTATMTVDTMSDEVLRALFLGLRSDISVSNGSLSAEEITARTGKWVPTSQVGFDTGSVSVTDDADQALTEDTDYRVDLRNGAILAIDGGAISDGDTIKVTATYGSRAGYSISAARVEQLTVRLLFDGRSLRTADAGKIIRIEVPEMTLRPAGGNDLMSEDWLAGQFAATLITRDGNSEPFTYNEYTVTATP